MTVGGGVGVDTDVRPDKTTYTLPLSPRLSIAAVPITTAAADTGPSVVVVVIYIHGGGGGNRTRNGVIGKICETVI